VTAIDERCSDCGTGLGELNRDRTGDLLCFRCNLKRYPDEIVEAPPEPVKDTSRGRKPASSQPRQVVLTSASAIRSEAVRWMWRDRVPLRGLTVLAGEKGLGKSICTNAMLPAALTRGELDGELEGNPVDVLVASAEDDWRAVVKPRLMAHGADLERVHRVAVEDENGDGMLTLPDDVARLEEAVTGLRAAGCPVGLLVIDPIGAFLTQSTDSHKDAHVRRALAPLAAMAERLDLAVIVVAHLTKDDSRRLISRVNGSGAFVNAARSVLGFVRDPDDQDGEQGRDRVLVHAASNWGKYAPSLAARVESRLVPVDDGSTADVGYLDVLGETTVSVDDIQRGRDDDHESVEAAIIAELAGGQRPSLDVKEGVAKRLGCSMKTVERHAVKMRAREELTIEKSGWPPTSTWALTLGTTPDTPNVPNGVPNAKPPMSTGIPGLLGDVRDTHRVSVPNANGHDPDAELERLQAKFPDLTELPARCRCSSPVVGVDDDGDAVCSKCGRAS
jgi:AAA domain